MKKRKVNYCRGFFCNKITKDIKCSVCGIWFCRVCKLTVVNNHGIKKPICLNCAIDVDIDNLNLWLEKALNKNNETLTYKEINKNPVVVKHEN